MIKDMNCSLIFRGQLNYPFQLIFSFAGCASYGSFNVSSVCVLITHCKRIYNIVSGKCIYNTNVQIWDKDFILLLFFFLLCISTKHKHQNSYVYSRWGKKITFNTFLYLGHYVLLNLAVFKRNFIVFVFLTHSWKIKPKHVNEQ